MLLFIAMKGQDESVCACEVRLGRVETSRCTDERKASEKPLGLHSFPAIKKPKASNPGTDAVSPRALGLLYHCSTSFVCLNAFWGSATCLNMNERERERPLLLLLKQEISADAQAVILFIYFFN